MQTASLDLKSQGVRGGKPSWKPNVGYISAQVDGGNGNYISVDAFQGQGIEYERREKCEIIIKQKGAPIFIGTFDELCELLKK